MALRPARQSVSSSSSRRSGIHGCHSPGSGRITALGVELTTIDAHRAPEMAADLERRLDDGVARQARRNRVEIRDFPGRAAADHSVILLVGSGRGSETYVG
jgi:hypothetical protein